MPEIDLDELKKRALEYIALQPHAEYKLWNGVLALIALAREQEEQLAAKNAEVPDAN